MRVRIFIGVILLLCMALIVSLAGSVWAWLALLRR